MNKILKVFSLIVISLFILSLFGWMVSHITKGDKDFGFITKPVVSIYSFPDLFTQSVQEVKMLPKTFIPTPSSFSSVNKLNDDLFVLTTYSDTSDSRTIALMNLKNDSIIYKWAIANPFQDYDRIINPLLFPEKSLVYSFDCKPNLRRIDSLGNVIWKQNKIRPHHAMNLDENGNIWTCSFEQAYYPTGLYHLNGRSVFYVDNYITNVDAETGKILYHKSVSEILEENNLSKYLLRSQKIVDPIHINDIEPALKSTAFFEQGDLFISSRNLSIVFQYRPSTGKVIKIIDGPFNAQHDVDILNDSTLIIFNNNAYNLWSTDSKNPPADSSHLKYSGDFYSDIARYDFSNDSISFIGESVFRQNKIYTHTEGLMEFIDPNTYFVEEQNSGLLWVISNDEVIYKNVLKSQHEGHHHLPNWYRIINHYD